MIPKDCVNSKCNKIIYVEKNKLHMMLQCDKCMEKRKENNL
jgi:hypothetical protein